jgi:TP901 family phage tail tape measure protein
MADGKVNVEITGNAAQLSQAAKQAASDIKGMATSIEGAGKQASSSLDNIDKSAGKLQSGLSKAVSGASQSFKNFGEAVTNGFNSFKNTSIVSQAESKLTSFGNSVTKTGGTFKTLATGAASNVVALSNTATAAAQVEGKFASMTTKIAGGAQGMSKLDSAVGALVPGLNLGALGFAGMGIAALKSASDFETSMARLQIMTGVTDKSSQSFKDLEAAAISVGEKTTFSSTEAANGLADLAAAGLNVKDSIAAINPVAQAAMINQVGISDAAKVATVSMNAFGLKASDLGKIIDVTTTAANLGVLQFEDFGQAMAAVGSVAKLSNQGLTDITSALIALTNNGQSAADAGTSIKSALLALINPSAEGAAAMKELGINAVDAQGKMRPFAEIVRQIEQSTKGMTDAQRNQLLATMAGSDGIRAFSGALGATITVQRDGKEVTLQGADALQEFQRQLDNSGGSAQKAADIMKGTFGAQLEELKGQVEELVRQFGTELLPVAKETVQVLGTKVEGPGDWFKGFKGLIPILHDAAMSSKDVNEGFRLMGENVVNAQGKVVGFIQPGQALSDWMSKHSTIVADSTQKTAELAKANDAATNTIISQSVAFKTNIQDNIQNRKALAESALAAQMAAQANKQAADSFEYNHKRLFDLNNTIDGNISSFQHLSGPMQAISDKYGVLTGKVNTLEIALEGLNRANDELNGKISANNSIINTMSMGVDQLALKHQNAKIAFDGTNHSLQEGYDQWVKYTEIQAAGGDGAVEAGKKAGDLAKQLTGVDKSFQPLLDTTYNAINANSKHKDSLVATTEQSAKLQSALDPLTAAQRKADDAFEEGATKARGHANALGVTSSAAQTATTAVNKATGQVEKYNETHPAPKLFNNNALQAANDIMKAVAQLQLWNGINAVSKVLTITTNLITNGSPAPSGGGGGGGGGSAPSRPAPTPVGGRSPLSTGASTFGLTSDLGSILKGGGIAAPLAAATQLAAQTAFSLDSLKSNIDQIVSLFKSIDSKALKVAADQAESVSKIASAASGMVDLFGKIKDYSSVGKETMKQVAADSVAMTQEYIAGASQFKVKQLEGAATYIETSGKVASAASSMADALSKLRDYKGPLRDSIAGFTGNVKDLVFDFVEYSRIFTKEALDGAATYIDTSQKVGQAASTMADGLAKVRNWSGLARESIAGFSGNVKDIVFDFSEYAPQFNEDTLAQATRYAEGTGKIGSAISTMADGLSKVRDWSGIARESMAGFAGNVKDIVFDFSEYGKIFTQEALKTASDFAETGGKVTSIIKAAVDGLAALKDYAGLNRANMSLFGSDMVEAVNSFESAGLLFKSDGLKAASDFAEAGGKVTGIIGKAVEGFAALDDYKALAADKLNSFMADLTVTMQDFQTAAQNFKPEVTAATAAFAESAGKITDGLGKAVGLFEGLAKYQGVPQKMLTAFLSDVRLTVQLAGQMVGEVDKSLMPQIDAFGTAIGKLFDGLSKAMGVFQGLEKYKSVPSAVITDFVNEIILTVNIAGTLADKTDKDLMDKAKAFAKSVDDIFGKLKGAIDVFKGLETYKTDTATTMQHMLEGIVEAITKMGDMNTKAEELYEGAVKFANKMADAGREIAKGMSAVGSGGGSGGSPQLPTDGFLPALTGGQPSRGFALGGLVQKSGVYTVGEFGPEEVFLPGGSRVASNTSSYNHSRTTRLEGNVYITIAPPAGTDERKIAQMVKAAIEEVDRQKGARRNNGF